MMQGDQYGLPIELLKDNGLALTPEDIDDLEVHIGSIRKTLKNNTVVFDDQEKTFVAKLTQSDTFLMNQSVHIQARILFKSGDVLGVDLKNHNIEKSISKVILK